MTNETEFEMSGFLERVVGRHPTHRDCTYILPSRSHPEASQKWLREKTHCCWCSAWKLMDNGQWRIWRDGDWCKPKPGELRSTEHGPVAT